MTDNKASTRNEISQHDEKEDRIRKNILLQDDARQSFFQLENLIFNIDAKAFGLVAIDTIFITISGYYLGITKWNFWYIPTVVFCLSLIFMLLCAMPRFYDRRDPVKGINDATNKSSEYVAAQIAVDYAHLFEKMANGVYRQKIFLFVIGILLTVFGIILLILAFIDP